MDFITVIGYVLAFVETAALLGALVFITRATKAGKNSPDKKKQVSKSVICLVAFLVLNVLRTYVLGA